MVRSPSWEANWFAASQIPRISRNPKVHYRTHKPPPSVPILDQSNPVHIPTSHLLEIRPNIIHPSRPTSPQWSLSLRFPHQHPIHPPLLTHLSTHSLIVQTKSTMFIHYIHLLHFSYMFRFYLPLYQGELLCPLLKIIYCYEAILAILFQ